jgi:hypothetical protein
MTTTLHVQVRVFHNVALEIGTGRHLGFGGCQRAHPVVEVFRGQVPAEVPDVEICEEIFDLLNVGHGPTWHNPPDPRAVAYRAQGNRSLSVGDLIAIRTCFYAVNSAGFEPVDTPHIVHRRLPGTVPLPVPISE